MDWLEMKAILSVVIAGFDPGIHEARPRSEALPGLPGQARQ